MIREMSPASRCIDPDESQSGGQFCVQAHLNIQSNRLRALRRPQIGSIDLYWNLSHPPKVDGIV